MTPELITSPITAGESQNVEVPIMEEGQPNDNDMNKKISSSADSVTDIESSDEGSIRETDSEPSPKRRASIILVCFSLLTMVAIVTGVCLKKHRSSLRSPITADKALEEKPLSLTEDEDSFVVVFKPRPGGDAEDGSTPMKERTRWPEMIGMTPEEGTAYIKTHYEYKYYVQVIEKNGITTKDIQFNRIRLFLDEDRLVERTPYIGR